MTEETPQTYTWHKIALLLVLTAVIVAALLPSVIPPGGCGGRIHRVATCAHHLSQLYKLGTTYAAAHRGKWPTHHGEQLWIEYTKGKAPLLDATSLEVLFCPVKGDEVIGDATDYRGPATPIAQLRPGDPVGADKPGNHGHNYGGNVLLMDGSVMERGPDDPEWRRCEALLRP